MNVFNKYAEYYDLLYRDKDYQGEADYVHGLIQKYTPDARSILNLGCGSGRHDSGLLAHGYAVTGVDVSEEMLAAARSRVSGEDEAEYLCGDVRAVNLHRQFDVVVSLFHVMSYQITNQDLVASFSTSYEHLRPGGVFIFDCWYGPGVLTDKPTVRVKEVENSAVRVTRIALPDMYHLENVVDVNYRIFVRDKSDGTVDEICEKHRMRYLFAPELRMMLMDVGFQSVCFEEWLTSSPLSVASWNALVAARKPL